MGTASRASARRARRPPAPARRRPRRRRRRPRHCRCGAASACASPSTRAGRNRDAGRGHAPRHIYLGPVTRGAVQSEWVAAGRVTSQLNHKPQTGFRFIKRAREKGACVGCLEPAADAVAAVSVGVGVGRSAGAALRPLDAGREGLERACRDDVSSREETVCVTVPSRCVAMRDGHLYGGGRSRARRCGGRRWARGSGA